MPTDERDDEVAELRRMMRDAEGVEWVEPPAGAWERVAAALSEEPADIRSLRPAADAPRRGRGPVVALVAAAVVLVVAGVTFALTRSSGDDGQVIASVRLAVLGSAGDGRAELVERDGHHQLRVETSGLEVSPGDGYLEVWLLDAGVTRFVSLGPLRTDGVYDVPGDVDLGEYPVVDVSVEPVDGDPAHSGRSVLRGELT